MRWGRAAVVLTLGFLCTRWLIPLLYPVVLTAILVALVETPVRILERLGFARSIACAVVLTACTCVCALMVILVGHGVWLEGRHLLKQMPSLYRLVQAALTRAEEKLPALTPQEHQLVQSIASSALQLLSRSVSGFAKAAGSIPTFLFASFVAVLASFFVSRDRTQLGQFAKAVVPARILREAQEIWAMSCRSVLGYVRAQCTIASLTGLSAGIMLFLLGSPYALLWGLICALLDLIPVVGPAGLLVPWAAIAAFRGDGALGLRLLGVLLVVALLRQLLEPRLIGSQTGVHPVSALAGMYIGVTVLGPVGLVAGPLLVAVAAAAAQPNPV